MGVELSRPSGAICFAAWKALFFREALTRLFSGRASWFWLLTEPAFHVGFLVFVFSVVRVRNIGGIDIALWVMIGLLAFFLFRRTVEQSMNGIGANRALFAYPNVKPVDTVLVRGVFEGFLMVVVAGAMMLGAALLGHNVIPADPMLLWWAFFCLWLLGLGFGLMVSVTNELIPEAGRVAKMAMMPLYFMSGVVFPLSVVPQPYREWLMFNPVAHGPARAAQRRALRRAPADGRRNRAVSHHRRSRQPHRHPAAGAHQPALGGLRHLARNRRRHRLLRLALRHRDPLDHHKGRSRPARHQLEAALMNAPDRIEIPAFLERKEPAAVYLWSSQRRLVILKDNGRVDLSADELRARAIRAEFDRLTADGLSGAQATYEIGLRFAPITSRAIELMCGRGDAGEQRQESLF